jgi:hypothetical protein
LVNSEITRNGTPEQDELARKLTELAQLESELAQCELDLATERAELYAFETRYLRVVGARYAELDQIQVQIAEQLAKRQPNDQAANERATRAREQAEESARTARAAQSPDRPADFRPPENLKRLYREAAKRIHPDLTTDPEARERRQHLMAEVNRAYEEGNATRLQAILKDWECSPELVVGGGVAAELVRTIRKIAQIKNRLNSSIAEMAQLRQSDLLELKCNVERAEVEGIDLLSEMASKIDRQISIQRERLENILRQGELV